MVDIPSPHFKWFLFQGFFLHPLKINVCGRQDFGPPAFMPVTTLSHEAEER